MCIRDRLLKVSCDQGKNFYLTHAGVPHIWSLEDAMHYNAEFMMAATHDAEKMFRNMWGDLPSKWNPKLKGYSRLRTIINYFTRMRLVDNEGNMDLKTKTFKEVNEKNPERIIENAVKGMLPKNKLGANLFRNLHVFSDDIHKFEAQKPSKINLNKVN